MSKIYVACLASYNNGRLHGEWIEATADVDAMHDEVARILRASKYPNVMVDCLKCEVGRRGMGVVEGQNFTGHYSCDACNGTGKVPSAEEFAVHDYDDSDDVGLRELGETSDLQAIAKLVEASELATDELGEDGPAIVAAYWGNVGCRPDDPSEAVEGAREAYQGDYDSLEAWAEAYADDTGMLDSVPENLRYYFDFAAWARGADVFMVRTGGHGFVFNNC